MDLNCLRQRLIALWGQVSQAKMKFLRFFADHMHRVPLVGPLFCFTKDTHKRAFIKFVIQWLCVTSPILLAVCFSEVAEADRNQFGVVSTSFAAALKSKFAEFLKKDGIYVYTVSFLAPFFYIIIGRLVEAKSTRSGADRLNAYKAIFPGYWSCFTVSVALLIATALSFAGALLSNNKYESTVLFFLTNDKAWMFYCISGYFWYLSILDELNSDSSYVNRVRSEEDQAVTDFAERLNKEEGR